VPNGQQACVLRVSSTGAIPEEWGHLFTYQSTRHLSLILIRVLTQFQNKNIACKDQVSRPIFVKGVCWVLKAFVGLTMVRNSFMFLSSVSTGTQLGDENLKYRLTLFLKLL
jgi:hypothetical protein